MTKQLGNCYEVHGRAITLDGYEGLLCHGTVFHPEIGWHGHCWIEHEEIVHDLANGKNIVIRHEVYYAMGKAKDIKRYTANEAREMTLETGHWGPWEGI